MVRGPAPVAAVSSASVTDHLGARSTLAQDVRRELLGRIAEGTYQPGERLIETRIAGEFGVSQGVVREALRQLEVSGLVAYEPHRGCRVRAVDQREVDEVSFVRSILEEAASRLAAGRSIDTTPLFEAVTEMDELARRGDNRGWVAQAAHFHRLIVVASGNKVLLDTWDGLAIEARTAQLVLASTFDPVTSNQGHRAIAEALASGDPELAADLSRHHEETYMQVPPKAGA